MLLLASLSFWYARYVVYFAIVCLAKLFYGFSLYLIVYVHVGYTCGAVPLP